MRKYNLDKELDNFDNGLQDTSDSDHNSLWLVLERCPHQVHSCYVTKAHKLHEALLAKVCITLLGGVRLKRRPELIRFKLGREFRLIYRISEGGLEPIQLMTRQAFDRELKRR
jgi:hypothetical protein